jgi:prefoldin subunit 5
MQQLANPVKGLHVHEIPTWMIRVAAVAMVLALLVLSVPVVWAAVSAGLGLLALTVLVGGGVVVFQAMPWALQSLENQLLKMRKAQAQTNPIEQLENDVLRRSERLSAFRQALAVVGGQIESIRQMVQARRHRDSGHVLQSQQRALQRLADFYAANLARLDQAQAALEQFTLTVANKKSEWDIAQAINAATQLLDPNAAQTLIQDLLTDEALRTVQNRFNTVFAELDIQMRSVDAPTRPLVGTGRFEQLDPLALPQTNTGRITP